MKGHYSFQTTNKLGDGGAKPDHYHGATACRLEHLFATSAHLRQVHGVRSRRSTEDPGPSPATQRPVCAARRGLRATDARVTLALAVVTLAELSRSSNISTHVSSRATGD